MLDSGAPDGTQTACTADLPGGGTEGHGSASGSLGVGSIADVGQAPPPLLRIEPLGLTVAVPAGTTLLAAAAVGGVVLPSSCRNGTCRACRCVATEGRVHYRIPWPGLSPDERAAGEVLPCVAYPDTAVTLHVPHARRA